MFWFPLPPKHKYSDSPNLTPRDGIPVYCLDKCRDCGRGSCARSKPSHTGLPINGKTIPCGLDVRYKWMCEPSGWPRPRKGFYSILPQDSSLLDICTKGNVKIKPKAESPPYRL